MTKNGALRPGRISGSLGIHYTKTLDPNGRFLTTIQLDSLMKSYNIKSEDQLVIYCQSGVRSSHFTFVLRELLEYNNVKNYDGSWIEWSHDLSLPAEVDSLNIALKQL